MTPLDVRRDVERDRLSLSRLSGIATGAIRRIVVRDRPVAEPSAIVALTGLGQRHGERLVGLVHRLADDGDVDRLARLARGERHACRSRSRSRRRRSPCHSRPRSCTDAGCFTAFESDTGNASVARPSCPRRRRRRRSSHRRRQALHELAARTHVVGVVGLRVVLSGPAVEVVRSWPADEHVVAGAAHQLVVAGQAEQLVVAGLAVDRVGLGRATERVVLRRSVHRAGENDRREHPGQARESRLL